jgi:MFS family permease
MLKEIFPDRKAMMLVTIAALGYFVDIYDLVLFNVVKRESLEFILGKDSPLIKDTGIFLFNMQMLGMLIGGILWGVWGDKKGRITVLFGSILLYSAANIINAFTYNITAYAMVRVIAGIGLAGELGAGITLVSETLHKEKRGYGTMIIVTFGALGAVLASLVANKGAYFSEIIYKITSVQLQNWQVAYVVGGLLGLMLLVMRMGTLESGMFKSVKQSGVTKGDFFMLFRNKKRALKYICCILIGLPVWYVIGVLVALSEDVFGKEFGIEGIKNGQAVMYAYIGLSVGDLISGIISQVLKSRKKVVYIYLVFNVILVVYFLFGMYGASQAHYYFICFMLGAATGYWAIFVTIASEQFGTNIRSTVTNTVPNFVRGAVIPITNSFKYLAPALGTIAGAMVVGAASVLLALIATIYITESFSKDLNYTEE